MSTEVHPNPDHAHDAQPQGSLRDYLIGFSLSVVLTAIPFWLVMTKTLGNDQATGLIIMGFAALQMIVHVIYFLHMNTKAEGGWVMMAVIFTLVLLVITLLGSLWVMYHLNTNMVPMQMPVD